MIESDQHKKEWNSLRSEDCTDEFSANPTTNFFPRTWCFKHKQHHRPQHVLFTEELRCTEVVCVCSKTYRCDDSQSNKFKFSSNGLNKRTLEESGDGPMTKYRKFWHEIFNVMSTNIVFRTIQHAVATNEQTNRALSYFYPKKSVGWNTHSFP